MFYQGVKINLYNGYDPGALAELKLAINDLRKQFAGPECVNEIETFRVLNLV